MSNINTIIIFATICHFLAAILDFTPLPRDNMDQFFGAWDFFVIYVFKYPYTKFGTFVQRVTMFPLIPFTIVAIIYDKLVIFTEDAHI